MCTLLLINNKLFQTFSLSSQPRLKWILCKVGYSYGLYKLLTISYFPNEVLTDKIIFTLYFWLREYVYYISIITSLTNILWLWGIY